MMNALLETSAVDVCFVGYTDEELVFEYRQFSNVRCFDELVRRYRPSLSRYLSVRYNLSREQLEEALQSTFLRVWQKCEQFDLSRSFRPWIFRIASSQTINLLREQRRRGNVVSLDAPLSSEDSESSWANELAGREPEPWCETERQELRLAVAKLPQKFRQAIELVFFQGQTRQSVADALDLTVSTVSRRVSKALELLGACLFNGSLSGSSHEGYWRPACGLERA